MAAVRAASDRVLAMAASTPDGALVSTPFGEQMLATYLRSRTAELVLHGLYLGTDIKVPPDALVTCGVSLVELAVSRGHGLVVVRALSGRGTLPPGFNILLSPLSYASCDTASEGRSRPAGGVRGQR